MINISPFESSRYMQWPDSILTQGPRIDKELEEDYPSRRHWR